MADLQGFPNVNTAFQDPETGALAAPWYQFFIALWKRTGSTAGGSIAVSGDLKAVAGTVPAGWLLCDGSLLSRRDNAALFAAIGTTWGVGDGSTTFAIPDLRGRVLVGTDFVTFPLGSFGGSANATLGVANLPSHSHSVTDPGHTHTVTDPGHVHTAAAPASNAAAGAAADGAVAGNTGNAVTGISLVSATTGLSVNSTGSGTSFSVMPPYAAVNWCIKT